MSAINVRCHRIICSLTMQFKLCEDDVIATTSTVTPADVTVVFRDQEDCVSQDIQAAVEKTLVGVC